MSQFAKVTALEVGDMNDGMPMSAATSPVVCSLAGSRATPCVPRNDQDFHEEFGSSESIDERGSALNLMGKVIALFFATAVFAAYCEGRVPLTSNAAVAIQEQAQAAPVLFGVSGVR